MVGEKAFGKAKVQTENGASRGSRQKRSEAGAMISIQEQQLGMIPTPPSWPPGNIGQCLQTFLVVTIGEEDNATGI